MSQISVACSRRALPRRICCTHPEFQHRQSAHISWSHSRRIMFQAHRAAKTCERGPRGPGCSCSKMCKRQKQTCGVSATKNVFLCTCLLVNGLFHCQQSHVAAGVLTQVGPVPVRLWCRLCGLSFSQCAMLQKLRSRARPASGSVDSKQPTCRTNMFGRVSCRLLCTCATDTFFNKHCSRTHGVVPKMLVPRRRSSVRIAFACRKIQLDRSQKCSVKCVHHSTSRPDEVRLRTRSHHDWNTPPTHLTTNAGATTVVVEERGFWRALRLTSLQTTVGSVGTGPHGRSFDVTLCLNPMKTNPRS